MVGKIYLIMAWVALYLGCYLIAPPSLQDWRTLLALSLMHCGSWFLGVVEKEMRGHGQG